MPPKESTYWTFKRVLTASSGVGIPMVALFAYLAFSGALNVTEYNYTEHCAGTPSDLCYLYFTATPTKDIYIQADSQWLETNPPIKTIKLQRTWGESWRTIDLTKPWSSQVKYALKLTKGKTYEFRFVAEKYDPRDVIEWDFNPKGVWGKALAKYECENEIVTRTKKVPHYTTKELFDEKNKTYYNVTSVTYTEEKYQVNLGCKEMTKKIKYAESEFEYEKEGFECKDDKCDKWCESKEAIIDGKCTDLPDSNGDGVCLEGESDCIELYYTTKIELK